MRNPSYWVFHMKLSTSMLSIMKRLFDEARPRAWWRHENNPCLFRHHTVFYADQSQRRRSTADSSIDFSYDGVLTRIRFGIDVGLVKMMELTGQAMDAILFFLLLSCQMVHLLLPSALAMICTICFDHKHHPQV